MRCILFETDDFYQMLKITPVIKLTWNEVIFLEDKTELSILSEKITKSFFEKGIIERGEKVEVGEANYNINLIENHKITAEEIFTALEEFSKQNGIGFIVNHRVQEDYFDFGLFLQLGDVHFHPEVILDGKRLVNDFQNKNLNRFCFDLIHGFLVDCAQSDKTLVEEVKAHREGLDYWAQFSDEELIKKGLVSYEQIEKTICNGMLVFLGKYFQMSYNVDVIYGMTKDDYDGIKQDVREKICKRF